MPPCERLLQERGEYGTALEMIPDLGIEFIDEAIQELEDHLNEPVARYVPNRWPTTSLPLSPQGCQELFEEGHPDYTMTREERYRVMGDAILIVITTGIPGGTAGRAAPIAGRVGRGGGGILARTARQGSSITPFGGMRGPLQRAPAPLPGDVLRETVPLIEAAQTAEQSGVVYLRTTPKTGGKYVGKAKSPTRFDARQGEHDRALGVEHDYEVLGRAEPGIPLDVLEETQIRKQGGLEREGGILLNKRHQMSDPRYRLNGGTMDDPNTR